MVPIRSNVESRGPARVTVLLLALNVLAFLFESAMPPSTLDQLVAAFGMVPARETFLLLHDPGQVFGWLLPIVSSMFLHGGWAHLVGNLLFLWVFGRALEGRLGPARFVVLYVLSGVAASQAQVLAAPWSEMPMIGASGAIAGVLGAHLLLFPRSKVTVLFPVFIFPMFFDVPALLFLGIWFLEQLMAGTVWALSPLAAQAGGVAWWAHVGGFIAGAALILTMAMQIARERERTRRTGDGRPRDGWGVGGIRHVRF